MYLNKYVYEVNSYCLEESFSNETIIWNLAVCKIHYNIGWKVQVIGELIISFQILIYSIFCNLFPAGVFSILFMGATVFTYAYFKQLRSSVPGKCFLGFSISFFIICLFLQIMKDNDNNSMEKVIFQEYITLWFGLVFPSLWMSVLCFDIWWTFK